MSTATTNTVIDHTSDAGFRTWVAEVITQLTGVGAVQTADTGQINTATVTRPSANTNAGYAILRTPDSTLYVRIDFGTDTSTTAPRMQITTGTGSNGSGSITGQTNGGATTFTRGTAPASTVTTYISAWCVVNGCIAFSWKESGATTSVPMGFLVVGVTVDGSGVITNTGYGVGRQNGAGGVSVTSVRTASPATTQTASAYFSVAPGDPTTSADSSGNLQAYLWQLNVKDCQPFLWANTIRAGDAATGTVFTVAMVGSTTHTYRACNLGASSFYVVAGATAGQYGPAIIWE